MLIAALVVLVALAAATLGDTIALGIFLGQFLRDGRPDAINRAQGLYPESDYYHVCGGDCSDGELAQMANPTADDADDKVYDIFVVFYDQDKDDTAADFYEGLARGAGRFHRTPNCEELADLVPEFCVSFGDLRLVM